MAYFFEFELELLYLAFNYDSRYCLCQKVLVRKR
jgi:hypothetical protein